MIFYNLLVLYLLRDKEFMVMDVDFKFYIMLNFGDKWRNFKIIKGYKIIDKLIVINWIILG